MLRKLSLSLEPFFSEKGQIMILMHSMKRPHRCTPPPILPKKQKRHHSEALHIVTGGCILKFWMYFKSWGDLHVATDLERLIVSAAKRETVSFTSSIRTLSEKEKYFDFNSLHTHLEMLPETTEGFEGGLMTVDVWHQR